jgi:alkylation response protein AidB-like acyl-CoA dehydrogenase
MLLQPTEDQAFLRETTARFLDEQVPVGELRRLRDDPAGFPEKYWRQGAELGWTSLLVSEEHGGGTISDSGVVDLTLIAYEFGRHAAPGPLLPANIVAAALSDAGSHVEVLEELLAGTAIASWCDGVEITVDGSAATVNGTARPVESAAQAAYLLVTNGTTHVLVPADAPGVAVKPMHSVDLTRRFGVVTFDNVRIDADAIVRTDADPERLMQLALVIANAESVGAMQTAFEMTVAWAFDRYSFGRPLASYQALKHRFADMKMWLESSHAIADSSARAVQSRSPEAAELLSAAKAYIGHYGSELVHDCVQMHGGIGVTYEHDLHLYLRRQILNRGLLGTPSDHLRHIADLVEKKS